jgi:branched-chain amino acid transport system permease protein
MWSLLFIYGLVNSAIILLQTIGFGLTFSISGIANFSYGALYILSGIITWLFLSQGFSLAISIIMSVLLTSLAGFLIYWLAIYRIRGMPLSEVIITFSLGVAIIEFLRWKGFVTYEFAIPPILQGNIFVGGVPVDFQRVIIFFSAFLLLVALYFFAHWTKIGLALRGVSQNEQTALCFGINTELLSSFSVMLGAGICALSANLILPLGIISVDSGYDVLLIAIAVTVVGGLGSSIGLLLSSLVFGYVQTATTVFFSSKWMMVVYLFSIIAVLMIKPSGILGKFKEIEERI